MMASHSNVRARARLLVGSLAALLLTVGSLASAESPVDFSGIWELDKGRSVFPSGVPSVIPGEFTMIVTQHGEVMRTERRFRLFGVERTVSAVYYLDGREAKNATWRGETITSRSHWQGASLVTESKGLRDGTAVEVIAVNRLEEDGRTLIMESTLLRGNQSGPEKSRMVFVRKSGSSP